MKRFMLLVLAVFTLFAAVACSAGGISQSDYDALETELDALEAERKSLVAERSILTARVLELEALVTELEKLVAELESAQTLPPEVSPPTEFTVIDMGTTTVYPTEDPYVGYMWPFDMYLVTEIDLTIFKLEILDYLQDEEIVYDEPYVFEGDRFLMGIALDLSSLPTHLDNGAKV